MNAPHILRIRFKKGTQEIGFWFEPDVEVVNEGRWCRVKFDGKRYVEFLAEAESWEVVPAEGWG